MSAFTQVISTRVHDNGTSEDALGANEFHEVIGDAALGIALPIGLEIA